MNERKRGEMGKEGKKKIKEESSDLTGSRSGK